MNRTVCRVAGRKIVQQSWTGRYVTDDNNWFDFASPTHLQLTETLIWIRTYSHIMTGLRHLTTPLCNVWLWNMNVDVSSYYDGRLTSIWILTYPNILADLGVGTYTPCHKMADLSNWRWHTMANLGSWTLIHTPILADLGVWTWTQRHKTSK